VCSAQIDDDSGIVRLPALDGLSGTRAKVNADTPIRDVDDPPVGTGEHPAVEVFDS
jgi:hypothetical protein